jgi:hypothetical protein
MLHEEIHKIALEPGSQRELESGATSSRTYLIGPHVFGQAGSTGDVSYLLVTGRAKTSQRGALKTGQCFDVASYTSFDAVPANFR